MVTALPSLPWNRPLNGKISALRARKTALDVLASLGPSPPWPLLKSAAATGLVEHILAFGKLCAKRSGESVADSQTRLVPVTSKIGNYENTVYA